jgi:hypothetical protein
MPVFIGHFAVAFAAKKLSPRTSLGTLFVATGFLDLLWPILLLLGIEHVRVVPTANAFLRLDLYDYPWSHSLATTLLWGALFGGLILAWSRDAWAALVVGATVVSHWVLDFLSHRADMPLWPGGPLVGLGLWNSVFGTIVVEGLLFAGGLWLYFGATRPRDTFGRAGAAAFAAFCVLIYALNVAGPPPPNASAMPVFGLFGWLFPLAAWWVDHHREPFEPPYPESDPA